MEVYVVKYNKLADRASGTDVVRGAVKEDPRLGDKLSVYVTLDGGASIQYDITSIFYTRLAALNDIKEQLTEEIIHRQRLVGIEQARLAQLVTKLSDLTEKINEVNNG